MRFFQSIVFIVFLAFFTLPVSAQVVPNLAVGTVDVKDKTSNTLNDALPIALGQVLIKMTGNPDITKSPDLQALLHNPDRWMQSYRYVSRDDVTGAWRVQVQFDQRALVQFLSSIHQALWRADRPLTLAWVQVDNNDNSTEPMLTASSQTVPVLALAYEAQQFGLPIVLPAMDAQDQSLVADSGLPFDVTKLKTAAQHYHASSVLAGNLSPAVDGSWEGQWLSIVNGDVHQWNTLGPSISDVMHQAMRNLDSLMATTYALRDNPALQTAVELTIDNVTSLDDYALIMHALKQLSSVAHIDVAQLDGAEMHLQLQVVGGAQALLQALKPRSDLQLMHLDEKSNTVLFNYQASLSEANTDQDGEGL